LGLGSEKRKGVNNEYGIGCSNYRNRSEMSCFCYILECADGTYYTGWSTDPQRRLKQHNAGSGARYTRPRRPVKLIYIEEQIDRSAAMSREAAIKKLTRKQKQALIAKQIERF
jgi:putative endonuclease